MLLEIIKQGNSKPTIDKIIDYVGVDAFRLEELINYFLGDDMRVSQISSWAVGQIGEKQPQLFSPYHEQFIGQLRKQHPHNAIKRNIVRLYQFVEVPEEFEGRLYEIALYLMLDSNEPIAVKAFSMGISERIALKYPDLIPELIQAVESVMRHASSGLKNRGKHALNTLQKALINL